MSPYEVTRGSLSDLEISRPGWDRVLTLAHSLVDEDVIPAVAVQIVQGDVILDEPISYGRLRLDDPPGPLPPETIYLIASITKPVVATAILLLVERGEIALNDRVVDLLPEFASPPRRPMTVRHLLTHTSGLPDQLPHNRKLRESNSPLASFFEGTCAVTLDFPPGHGVQYQSMGFVLLAEIIQRVTGQSCRDFVQQEIFEHFGMNDSALGAPDDWFEGSPAKVNQIAEIRVPEEQQDGIGWNWNRRYWRQMGAPWGGMLASVDDVARFCVSMMTDAILAPSTQRQATANQLEPLPNVPEVDRRTKPWGLGWRHNWVSHSATFSDLLGPDAIGHWGATGTVCWFDPQTDTACVILSTQPLDRGRNHLVRLSNAIAAAIR